MLRNIIVCLLFLALAAPALAQELTDFGLPDDAYATQYFGTHLVILTPEPLDYPAEGWWTDALPEELTYGNDYLIGLVNARRMDNGVEPLLNPDEMLINLGWEEETEDGFAYSIDFVDIRPSEVELMFSALGGIEQLDDAPEYRG